MSVPPQSHPMLLTYAEPSSSRSKQTLFPYHSSDDLLDDADERDDYESWHDDVHIPALLRLTAEEDDTQPLFGSCTRWVAVDCNTPSHLCLYDLATSSATRDPSYAALIDRIESSQSDKDWFDHDQAPDATPRLPFLDRRVYEPLAHASTPPALNWDGWARHEEDLAPFAEEPVPARPGRYMTVVEVEMHKFAEGEFNRWFDEEHIPLLMRVPGWVRSRRFALGEPLGVPSDVRAKAGVRWADCDGDSAETDEGRAGARRKWPTQRQVRPPKYLAMHEWASLDAFSSKEFKRATSTPWRAYVLNEDRVLRYELRVFRLAGCWIKG